MSKSLFASEKVMEDYLSALLNEDNVSPIAQKQEVAYRQAPVALKEAEVKPPEAKINPVAKLLEEAKQRQIDAEPIIEVQKPKAKVVAEPVIETAVDTQVQSVVEQPPKKIEPPKAYREGDFQALYFEVAGLILAVPLTELGGIHNLQKPNSLFGKPDWFMGVMVHREEKINVVDSAQWVMPEKYDKVLAESLNYKYLIMLGDSQWGLACESLVNTITLQQEDVKWRESSGKRPWLAGMVKEKMCALLNVEQLINLLDQGLGS
ncbi:chemotaxis protein CheW [Saccharobesus litoralis]|uniref:Chemotaxis protein CheW n=1 Tax=Saccharobesus litoralis TaxID=2172099 RepID=A0A2S0VT56_9ALTE|nr:chemotaxis protein CheW [Saccharobesus litoralis]AWB67391.1 chemotaxis protein CheW [Saccharobesus litoralis]